MNTIDNKSIIIDGDKSLFLSKSAICRFKKDLRDDNKERLAINNYLSNGWSYKIISNTDTEIKIELVQDKDKTIELVQDKELIQDKEKTKELIQDKEKTKELIQDKDKIKELVKNKTKEIVKDKTKEIVKDKTKEIVLSEQDEKRKILKEKLKIARMNKLSPMQMKQNLRNKVPADVLDAYLELKKVQLKVPVPPPDIVLSKPDEFKQIIHTMVQSFGMFKGNNNPVVNYYKLLAKHLDLPTTFEPTAQQADTKDQTNEFIKMLRKQRENTINEDVDDEMKEIYNSLGINMEGEKQKQKSIKEDNEMKEIYKSLGINIEENENETQENENKTQENENKTQENENKTLENENKTQENDNEMKEIYKSLGINIEEKETQNNESIKEDGEYIII